MASQPWVIFSSQIVSFAGFVDEYLPMKQKSKDHSLWQRCHLWHLCHCFSFRCFAVALHLSVSVSVSLILFEVSACWKVFSRHCRRLFAHVGIAVSCWLSVNYRVKFRLAFYVMCLEKTKVVICCNINKTKWTFHQCCFGAIQTIIWRVFSIFVFLFFTKWKTLFCSKLRAEVLKWNMTTSSHF